MASRFGGITLAKVKTFAGRCGEAFSADIHVDGRLVGVARNDGNGGCNFYDFYADGGKRVTQTHPVVTATALTLYGAEAFEPEDSLVWDLLEAHKLSRARTTVHFQLPEDGDFWNKDSFAGPAQYRSAKGYTPEQVRAQFPKARVWDKERMDFV